MSEAWDAELEDWQTDSDEYDRLERNGLLAAGLGVAAQTAALIVCCTYGLAAVPVLICGIAAVFIGKSVLDTGVDGAPRAYGIVGMVTGMLASIWSALVLLACAAYLGLYVGMFGLIVALGNA